MSENVRDRSQTEKKTKERKGKDAYDPGSLTCEGSSSGVLRPNKPDLQAS